MPALIEATEMMIQHVDIITMVPNSFIQQLRAYNVEQAKNGHQKVTTLTFFGQNSDKIMRFLTKSKKKRFLTKLKKGFFDKLEKKYV